MMADRLDVQAKYRSLYAYFLQNRYIEPIRNFDAAQLHVTPGDVLQKLQSADSNWEEFVPAQVARLIKENGLFGCPGRDETERAGPQHTPDGAQC